MIDYREISEAVDRLRTGFDWTHAFIREWYFATSRHLTQATFPGGGPAVGDAAGELSARMVVAPTGDETDLGVEFLCHGVHAFSIEKTEELSFNHRYDKSSRHLLDFGSPSLDDRRCYLHARQVFVRFLGRSYVGPALTLGHEFPSDVCGRAAPLDDVWRQCVHCGDAWKELSGVRYSRCPGCQRLTCVDVSTT